MYIRDVDLDVTSAGSGTPLLWSHGMTGSLSLDDETALIRWDQIASLFRVIRWDSRGHGKSGFTSNPQDFTWPNLALDAIEIAAALGHPQFVLGGASMGCGMAVHAALLAPEKIKGLLLVTPPTAWETRLATLASNETMAQSFETQGISALLEAWGTPTTFWGAYSNNIYLSHLAKMDPQPLPLIFRGASRSDMPARQALGSIQVPTLILAWDDDIGHPLSTAQILHEKIQGSQLVVAHSLDDVFAWTDRVIDFLKGL